MKKWTNREVSALSASVAELGYSKGIRAFLASADNENGRSFSGCEYMIRKQSRRVSDELQPADVDIKPAPVMAEVATVEKTEKVSILAKIIKRIFGM